MTQYRTADEIQAEDVELLWSRPLIGSDEEFGIPRGMISFIAGKPDQGKGLVAAHIAAEVSRNGGKVLYSAQEDADGLMTRPRLEAAGAVLENITLHKFVLPTDQVEVSDFILREGIDLVVMDPVAAHLSGVSRHSDSIRKVLTPFTRTIEAAQCGVILIEHVNKKVPLGSHPLNAIGGSGSGLVAACRVGFLFGTDPADEDQRALACIKGNILPTEAKKQALFLEFDEAPIEIETKLGAHITKLMPKLVEDRVGHIDAVKLVTKKEGEAKGVGRPNDKRSQAAEWLSKYLTEAGGPVLVKLINEDAGRVGMATKTLRRAANEMGIVRDGNGAAMTWDLSLEVKQMLAGAQQSLAEGTTEVPTTPTVAGVIPAPVVKKDKPPKQLPEVQPSKDELPSDAELNAMLAELGQAGA